MLKRLFYSLISLFILSVQIFSAEHSPLSDYYDIAIIPEIDAKAAEGTVLPLTIRQWNESLMPDVVRNMGVFLPQEVVGIIEAHNDSIYRKLSIIDAQRPHVAVARVIYESKGQWFTHPIHAIFSSTIQHDDKSRFSEQCQQNFSSLSSYGIAPYSGSPCKTAHSERAVGVYLENHLSQILKDKGSEFVLIQIKTSLGPCTDCQNFWKNSINISKKKGDTDYFDFGVSTEDKITIDWLEKLRGKLESKPTIAISISSSIKIDYETTKSSLPVERSITPKPKEKGE